MLGGAGECAQLARQRQPDTWLAVQNPAAGHWARAQPALDVVRGADSPLVIVAHALAAAVAPLVATRSDASLVVYLCPAPAGPFAGVDVGTRAIRSGFPFPPDRDDGTSVWDVEAAIAAMYAHLPSASARVLAARLLPGASTPDSYPLDRHPDVPAAVVAARDDEFFEPEWTRRVARAVLETDAVEIDGGHFPMIAAPSELAQLLERCAAQP